MFSIVVNSLNHIVEDDIREKIQENKLSAYMANETYPPADGTCTELQKFHPCASTLDLGEEDFATLVALHTILPAVCDKIYRWWDIDDKLRLTCPNTMCCRICNTVEFVRHCAAEESNRDNRNSSSITAGIIKIFQELMAQEFTNRNTALLQFHGSRYGVDGGVLDEFADAVEWAAETAASLAGISNTTWSSCARTCEEEYAPKANWYGRSPDCLRTENRSWVDSDDDSDEEASHGNNTTIREPVCTCDVRARAWSNRVLAWHVCAVSVAVFLVGLQAWVALLVDSEKICSCRDGAAAAAATAAFPRSLSVGGDSSSGSDQSGSERRKSSSSGGSSSGGSSSGSSSIISSGNSMCTRGLALSSMFSVLLVGCLGTELAFLAAATSGPSCANQGRVSVRWTQGKEEVLRNLNFMKSWVLLNTLMLSVAMFAGIMPIVRGMSSNESGGDGGESRGGRRRKGADSKCGDEDYKVRLNSNTDSNTGRPTSVWRTMAAKARRWAQKGSSAKRAYDDLFSFSRGRYYVYMRIVSEMVEVGTQTTQLYSFAPERPYAWIVTLSAMLVLNGLSMPAPLVLGRCVPVCKRETRIILAGVDTVFDVGYLLLAVIFSEKDSFGSAGTWWIAVLGVMMPVLSLTRRLQSMARSLVALPVVLARRMRSMSLGGVRRRSAGHAIGARGRGLREKGIDAVPTRKGRTAGHRPVQQPQAGTSRGAILLSLLTSAYCIACGAVFLQMAFKGDAACRSMLGDALWEGSNPKIVILKSAARSDDDGRPMMLRGGCNFMMIVEIDSTAAGAASRPPLEKLPSALAQLGNLKSLVLSGHRIASDGVPASILDGTALPLLTRLEFGEGDPVRRALDLSGTESRHLVAFPRYVLRFMTDLESLRLRGTNISCFPPRSSFSRLSKLRALDLSGTLVDYLPPSALFEHPLLENMNLSGTPVWRSLDWSAHGLGSTPAFAQNWRRLTRTLPMLESLNVSGNCLTNVLWALDLAALPRLERLDVSQNPGLTPPPTPSFSWWKVLSTHPTLGRPTLGGPDARFIGLANVGLRPGHVGLKRFEQGVTDVAGLTCDELRWAGNTMTDNARVDLSGNFHFDTFADWGSVIRCGHPNPRVPCVSNMRCDCPLGKDCAHVDEGMFRLLQRLISNVRVVNVGMLFQPKINTISKIVSLQQLFATAVEAGSKLTNIEFTNMGEYDDFPVALGGLNNLEHLSLEHTGFTDKVIPEGLFERLTKLRSLNLGSCSLSGPIPAGISKMSNLAQLILSYNNFTGTIPQGLFGLTKLSDLRIGSIPRLTGSFGERLPDLKALVQLEYFNTPEMHGSIPDGITTLTGLTELVWTDQSGTPGTIPAGIGALTNLRKLTLRGIQLRGEIPESIGDLGRLTALNLYDNPGLNGTIPASITRLTRLRSLSLGHLKDLENDSLHGDLPAGFEELKYLELLTLPEGVNASTVKGVCPVRDLSGFFYKCCCTACVKKIDGKVPNCTKK